MSGGGDVPVNGPFLPVRCAFRAKLHDHKIGVTASRPHRLHADYGWQTHRSSSLGWSSLGAPSLGFAEPWVRRVLGSPSLGFGETRTSELSVEGELSPYNQADRIMGDCCPTSSSWRSRI
jgi:hypothetical protein